MCSHFTDLDAEARGAGMACRSDGPGASSRLASVPRCPPLKQPGRAYCTASPIHRSACQGLPVNTLVGINSLNELWVCAVILAVWSSKPRYSSAGTQLVGSSQASNPHRLVLDFMLSIHMESSLIENSKGSACWVKTTNFMSLLHNVKSSDELLFKTSSLEFASSQICMWAKT